MSPDEPQIAAATPPAPPSRPAPRRSAPSGIDEQLRRAIEESGMSCRAVAAAAGVPEKCVQRFVKGERDLKLETAAKLATALGLKLVETGRPRRGR
jgi:ribosome-binding protein aMBF1 (putative translation factor)